MLGNIPHTTIPYRYGHKKLTMRHSIAIVLSHVRRSIQCITPLVVIVWNVPNLSRLFSGPSLPAVTYKILTRQIWRALHWSFIEFRDSITMEHNAAERDKSNLILFLSKLDTGSTRNATVVSVLINTLQSTVPSYFPCSRHIALSPKYTQNAIIFCDVISHCVTSLWRTSAY